MLVSAELFIEAGIEERLDGLSGGLLVEGVRSNGARADLRRGDIILALIARGETSEIKTVKQFNELLG